MSRELFSEIPKGHRILITGGAGFIATALTEKLAEHNEVVLFDLGFEGMPITYSPALDYQSVRCVEGNILDLDAVRNAVRDSDMVIHLAAVVGVKNVLERARDTINVNFLGTSNVLTATEGHSGLHRVVYFSTSEVFGGNSFRVHEKAFSSIGSVNEARWSYSISKLAGEHLLHAYHREFGLPSVIVRPFNVFGPKRLGDHAMKRFIENALRDEPLEVHGDGSQIRSWCYIDDFCDGVLRTMVRENAIGEDFNLGNSLNTVTIYDLAKRVISLLDSSSDIRLIDIDFSDIDLRVPSTEKARRLLDYFPQWHIDEAIPMTADWYRTHLHAAAAITS